MGARGGLLREGLGRVVARPLLPATLALLELLVAALALRPLAAGAAALLDLRPAATQLAAGDDGLLLELAADHPELEGLVRGAAEGALLVWLVVGWLLAGAVVACLVVEPRRGPRALVDAALRHAPRMIGLGLLGLVVRLVPLLVGAALVVVAGVNRFGGARALLGLVAAVGGVVAVGWALVSVALDAARARAIADPERGLWRCLGDGLALVRRRPGGALALALVSLVGAAATTGLALLAGALSEGSGPLHAAASFSAGWLRAAVSLGVLVGAALLAADEKAGPPPS